MIIAGFPPVAHDPTRRATTIEIANEHPRACARIERNTEAGDSNVGPRAEGRRGDQESSARGSMGQASFPPAVKGTSQIGVTRYLTNGIDP